MPEPRVQETSHGRVYFHDAEGVAWRIHDATYHGGRWKTASPPNMAATQRVFVAKDGTKRVTMFTTGEDRRLLPELLTRQLQRAGYLGERFDASRCQPR